MTTALTKKSGKGVTDGVISELATFWDILPGHADDVSAASKRLTDAINDYKQGFLAEHKKAAKA